MSKEQQPVADDLDDGLEYDVQLSDNEDAGFVNDGGEEGISNDETEINDNTTTTTTTTATTSSLNVEIPTQIIHLKKRKD